MFLFRLIRMLSAWFGDPRDARNARTTRIPVAPGTAGRLSTVIAAGQKAGRRRRSVHTSACCILNSIPFAPGSLPVFLGRDGIPPACAVWALRCIGVGAWQAASGITHGRTLSFRLPRPYVPGHPDAFCNPHPAAGLAIRLSILGHHVSSLLLAAAGAGVRLPASPGRCPRRIAAPHCAKGVAYVPSHPVCVQLCPVPVGLSDRPSRRDPSRR
jgi:hypothetical protein